MPTKKKDEQVESLKPTPPPSLAPRGIRSFTVYRNDDETGVSGTGAVSYTHLTLPTIYSV